MTDNKKDIKEQPLVVQGAVYAVILTICLAIMSLLVGLSWAVLSWGLGGCP